MKELFRRLFVFALIVVPMVVGSGADLRAEGRPSVQNEATAPDLQNFTGYLLQDHSFDFGYCSSPERAEDCWNCPNGTTCRMCCSRLGTTTLGDPLCRAGCPRDSDSVD